jgi:hypothetical protein
MDVTCPVQNVFVMCRGQNIDFSMSKRCTWHGGNECVVVKMFVLWWLEMFCGHHMSRICRSHKC